MPRQQWRATVCSETNKDMGRNRRDRKATTLFPHMRNRTGSRLQPGNPTARHHERTRNGLVAGRRKSQRLMLLRAKTTGFFRKEAVAQAVGAKARNPAGEARTEGLPALVWSSGRAQDIKRRRSSA